MEKKTYSFVPTTRTEIAAEVTIVVTGILLTVGTTKVTSVKGEVIVHLFIITIKVVLEAPDGEPEEMRL